MSSFRYASGVGRRPFPAFRLETADGETVTERVLAGQPSVVYLGRHPG